MPQVVLLSKWIHFIETRVEPQLRSDAENEIIETIRTLLGSLDCNEEDRTESLAAMIVQSWTCLLNDVSIRSSLRSSQASQGSLAYQSSGLGVGHLYQNGASSHGPRGDLQNAAQRSGGGDAMNGSPGLNKPNHSTHSGSIRRVRSFLLHGLANHW